MKKLSIFLLATVAVALLSFRAVHVDNFTADASASKLTWKGYKVTGEHAGTIALKNGSLQIDHGMLKGGSFEIDMNSMACTDLQGEYADKLMGHLKSPDFFNAAGFPTAKLVIKKAIATDSKGNYKIVADLTIKGITKEVKFNSALAQTEKQATATGKVVIDRSEFDIRFGSGSFFDGLGDKTIYDDFDINFTLVANK